MESQTVRRVTIGITCYNAADTIGAALDSAIAQSWPAVEIVVVDDGSSDASCTVIRDFIAARPGAPVRLIDKKVNEGFPAALNTILEHAAGEIVAFFDDDDVSLPARIERQVARLDGYAARHPGSVALCYANRRVEPEHGPPHVARAIGRHPREPHGPAVADYILWSKGEPSFCWGMFGSCTLAAPVAVLRDLGGFDPAFRRCAEWDLAIRHALQDGHFIAVDDALVVQRKTPGQDKAGKAPLRYALALRRKHRAWLAARHAYWGALLVARSRHAGARGQPWASRMLYAGAALLAWPILRERLRRR